MSVFDHGPNVRFVFVNGHADRSFIVSTGSANSTKELLPLDYSPSGPGLIFTSDLHGQSISQREVKC